MSDNFTIKIRRQDGPDAKPYWQEFEVNFRPGMNVVIALQDIRRDPVTIDGVKADPVVWECSCLEEVCGSCAMVINGRARQACSALIEDLDRPVTLEPLAKFPVVRDLMVDRSSLFENFARVRAWIPIDGTYPMGPGPQVSQEEQEAAYPLARCITCGCCLAACPQVNNNSSFMGAAVLNQATLLNSYPTGRMNRAARLDVVRGDGGLAGCGNAQNCERVCPKSIPLVSSIARLNREALLDAVKRWLGK
ncbi:MAG: succinate dehydrogenase iron-sulfur subunit [Nitrospirae bacterium]|nr:succinate dehydrogenase iron-sulfur subunit [Nitrospirota bacterium]